MFSRPKILFLVSLLFVALLNPKFNPYLPFKFLIFYHSSSRRSIIIYATQKCVKRELLSLIGKLSFACKVVPAGRIFLRRLIDLSMTVKHLHHHIRISRDAQLDLVWWYDFLPSWSGSSLILDTHWTTSSDMKLYTDASGTEGWGAFWSDRWLQARWSPTQADMPILWKELFAIVSAVNSWVINGLNKRYCFTVITKQL